MSYKFTALCVCAMLGLSLDLSAASSAAPAAAAQQPAPLATSRWSSRRHNVPPVRAQTQAQQQQQQQSAPHAKCEYEELLTNLHDRVGILATLDEDQRNRLENIDKKLSQFEASNLGRLDSLRIQQSDFTKRLDSLEHIQRLTRRQVEELQGDFDVVEKHKSALSENALTLERVARQAGDEARSGNALNDSKKLDALAVLLTSTRSAVEALQAQLATNITKLTQVTSNLQRRFNSLQRRQQQGQVYLPPQQPNYFASGGDASQLVTSCAQGAPTANGILQLKLTASSEPFYVRCDETSFGGGWTIIQNRFNGDVNFQRDWLEYKAGFGNLAGEFFIGLEKLHALTASAVHELLIVLEDFDGAQRSAKYDLFAIGNEQEFYALKLLGEYAGNAGDALTYHAGSKFSTFDNDNDGCVDCNCALSHMGAWWYNWCDMSNLNGKYFATDYDKVPTNQGVYWHQFHGPNYSLQKVRMMIRPVASEQESRR